MSGPDETPPDFGKVIDDAREESERQAAEILARLKASLPKPPALSSEDPLADD